MAFTHGKNAVFKLDSSGGSLTDISQYITSVTPSFNADTAEVSTLGDSSKDYIAGLKDATISIEGKWDPTIDALIWDAFNGQVEKSFEYGPAGGTTGLVKFSGETLCTSYEPPASVDDAVTFTAELQVVRGVTRGTFA